MEKLPDEILQALRPLEAELQAAVASGYVEKAAETTGRIQTLFGPERRRHHRLLRAKLYAFEAALDANRLAYAESGFSGIRKLAGSTTRLHLEATSLLAVTLIRQQKLAEAKRLIQQALTSINNIKSERTRHQFQKRLITRLEEEAVLAALIGSGTGQLDAKEVHEEAVRLLQANSIEELHRLVGNCIPAAGIRLLQEVRTYSLNQLPVPDRKLLPTSSTAEMPQTLGRRVSAAIQRILWKTCCHEESQLFKLWSKRVPKVFNDGYFAAAVTATLTEWRIGIPLLASGLVALLMKYTAEEFCAAARPKSLMIPRGEKSA